MSQVSRVSINVQYATDTPTAPKQEAATEVEYRWGRITTALTVLILIVVASWYLFFQGTAVKPSPLAVVEPPSQHAKAHPSKALPQKTQHINKPIPQSITKVVEVVTPAQIAIVSSSAKASAKESTASAPTTATTPIATPLEPVPATEEIKPITTKIILKAYSPAYEPAMIHIHSPRVLTAQLSQKLVKRVPVDELPSVVFVPKGEILKIHFVTEYHNLAGQWIYHDWYREGVRMARVKLRPHKNKMLALSSKNIDNYMQGGWQVKVVDDANMLLAIGKFEVRNLK